MHNKTDRFGIPLKSQTSSLVGPTTYTVICKSQLKNRVPFLSSAKVEPTFFNKSFCDTYYQLPEGRKTVLACSPSYSAPRTFDYETVSPGPAAHNVKPVKCHTQADRITDPKKLRKYYVCRVPYTLVGTGPSIPTKLNANGYTVNPYGDVTPIPPTDVDSTVGPARYSVGKKSRYDSTYRGIDWSVGKTRREFYNVDYNIPGPAEYGVKIPACSRDKENDDFREMARLLTFIPRFLDKQEMMARKNNYPGPGDYDITKCETCKRCPPLESTAFFSGSKRFKFQSNNYPSPSTYFYKPSKYNVSKLRIPFGVGSMRFPRKNNVDTPSPADYEIKGVISGKLEKNTQYADQKPPFGKSACRVTIEISKDTLGTPSPQRYNVEYVPKCKLYTTSTFKSKIERFPKQCKTLEGAPALYNDLESYNNIKNKKSYNVTKISFNSKCPKKGLFDGAVCDTPSPASYETGMRPDTKGFLVPTSPRWKEPKDKFPGPGSYLVAFIIGISGACRREELTKLTITDIEDKETILIIRIPETKNGTERVFTILNPTNSKIDYLAFIRKYIALRPPMVDTSRFFLKYVNNKCTKQPVGINTFGKMPSIIAKYLNSPDPAMYTGHCFRRSSATMLANSGGDLLTVKKHGGWKSSTVAESYVDSTLTKRNNISNLILMDDDNNFPCTSQNNGNTILLEDNTLSTTSTLATGNSSSYGLANISNTTVVSKSTDNSLEQAKGLKFINCTNCTFNIDIVNN